MENPANLPEGLSAPAQRALSGAGIHTLEALTQFSEAQIRQLHGIGPHALKKLAEALAAHGMSYSKESLMKTTLPQIEDRPSYYYLAVRLQAAIPFGKHLNPAWGKVNKWLAAQGQTAHGPAIIRYLTTDMSTRLNMDVGFIIDQPLPGNAEVFCDMLPAGKYACLMHTGSYRGNGVYKANVTMVEWSKQNNISWDTSEVNGVEWWKSRVEWYFNDPAIDPDPQTYKTELTFMVK